MKGLLILPTALLLGACGVDEPPMPDPSAEPTGDPPATVSMAAPNEFWTNLQVHCGEAFRGQATEVSAVETDFSGEMTVHFRECSADEMRIPVHVGEDRSRTWILTRTPDGLRLKHDHRHEDGTEHDDTQYGGDTQEAGTANEQAFHADEYTAGIIPEAATNIWTIQIHPGQTLSYQLVRVGTDRRVRFEFDLSQPVEAPPAPWGYEGT